MRKKSGQFSYRLSAEQRKDLTEEELVASKIKERIVSVLANPVCIPHIYIEHNLDITPAPVYCSFHPKQVLILPLTMSTETSDRKSLTSI